MSNLIHRLMAQANREANELADLLNEAAEALSQQGEPVAYHFQKRNCFGQFVWDVAFSAPRDATQCFPLYAAPQPAQQPLSDTQCDAIYRALDEWAKDIDSYDFGLPAVSGGGAEGARPVIRKAAHGIGGGE